MFSIEAKSHLLITLFQEKHTAMSLFIAFDCFLRPISQRAKMIIKSMCIRYILQYDLKTKIHSKNFF